MADFWFRVTCYCNRGLSEEEEKLVMGNVVTTGAASGRVGQRGHVAGEIMVKG